MANKSTKTRGKKTASFRIGRARAFLRGRVWYFYYHEHGRRHQPRVGPVREPCHSRNLKHGGGAMNRRGDPESGEGPGISSSTSLSLLERVKTQDRGAWQRLVDVYAPLVRR